MRTDHVGRNAARVEARKPKAEAAPWKLLLWTALAGLIFGLIGFGENRRGTAAGRAQQFPQAQASGDIVI